MIGAVESGSPDLNSVVGCLDDGILFRMKATAELMAFAGRNA